MLFQWCYSSVKFSNSLFSNKISKKKVKCHYWQLTFPLIKSGGCVDRTLTSQLYLLYLYLSADHQSTDSVSK